MLLFPWDKKTFSCPLRTGNSDYVRAPMAEQYAKMAENGGLEPSERGLPLCGAGSGRIRRKIKMFL
jgi:hypothetical protein